jgi:hypothetical protein
VKYLENILEQMRYLVINQKEPSSEHLDRSMSQCGQYILIIDFDDVLVANSLNGTSPLKKDIILRPHTLDLLKSL